MNPSTAPDPEHIAAELARLDAEHERARRPLLVALAVHAVARTLAEQRCIEATLTQMTPHWPGHYRDLRSALEAAVADGLLVKREVVRSYTRCMAYRPATKEPLPPYEAGL
jgi:hypothetical protein